MLVIGTSKLRLYKDEDNKKSRESPVNQNNSKFNIPNKEKDGSSSQHMKTNLISFCYKIFFLFIIKSSIY